MTCLYVKDWIGLDCYYYSSVNYGLNIICYDISRTSQLKDQFMKVYI